MKQNDINDMLGDVKKALAANNKLLSGCYGQLDSLQRDIESNTDKFKDEDLQHYRKATEEVREIKKKLNDL